jgi:hypothetical protein
MKTKSLIPVVLFLSFVAWYCSGNGQSAVDLPTAVRSVVFGKTPKERLGAMSKLRVALAYGSAGDRTTAIRAFLDSKMDTPTGQGFKIDRNGFLSEAPTLRTFLLDQMGQQDPAAAAAYSREILNSPGSPDEWAVALRNLARGDTSADGCALLESKTGELLRNTSWQQAPSVGYLEAFDAAVYVGGTNLLSPLSDLVRRKDNQGVAHAAFLAMDRLTFNDPADVLAALEAHPDWMQGREVTRADYFARADVEDPVQRAILESYLLDPARTPAELRAFAGVFPNANFMISQNLLTDSPRLDAPTLRRRDSASLQVVNQWLTEPRFGRIRQALEIMQVRLQQFVNQEH